MKSSKLDVLTMYWEKSLNEMVAEAMKKKDKVALKTLMPIMALNKDLKREFLK